MVVTLSCLKLRSGLGKYALGNPGKLLVICHLHVKSQITYISLGQGEAGMRHRALVQHVFSEHGMLGLEGPYIFGLTLDPVQPCPCPKAIQTLLEEPQDEKLSLSFPRQPFCLACGWL